MSSGRTLGEVVDVLEAAYPLAWAEDWDRAGLVLGDRTDPVEHVLLAVDPTLAVAREAAARGPGLVVAHHPLLLRGAHFLPAADGKGAVVTALLRAGAGLWCGHTNVDRATRGTVGAWTAALGLENPSPIVPPREPAVAAHGSELFGLGVRGTLPEPTTTGELTRRVAALAPGSARGVVHTGDADRPVRTVAVCPGAGDSLLDRVAELGVDAYVTSDLRHHPALEHLEASADPAGVPALIDVAHAASEALWLPLARDLLSEALPGLPVELADAPRDPWTGHAA